MQRSKTEIYLHFVWATYRRLPLITPALEPQLYQVLTEQAQRLGCQVLAVGGVADHVHLVVGISSKYAPFEIAKQVKGASSAWVRRHVRPHQTLSAEPFGWQDNYACFSLSRMHLKHAIYYVTHQSSITPSRNYGGNGKKLTKKLHSSKRKLNPKDTLLPGGF